MNKRRLWLFSLIVIGVLILGVGGFFVYKNFLPLPFSDQKIPSKEISEKEKIMPPEESPLSDQKIPSKEISGKEKITPLEESPQDILTKPSNSEIGFLTAENFKASFEYPKEWGDFGIRLDQFDKIQQQLYPPIIIKEPDLAEGDFKFIDGKSFLDSPFQFLVREADELELRPINRTDWEKLLNLPLDKWIGNPEFEELKRCCLMNNIVFFEKAQEKYSKRGKTMSYQQIFEASSTLEFIEIAKEIINEIPDRGLKLDSYKTKSGNYVSLTQYPEEFKDAVTPEAGPWWEDYFDPKERKQAVIDPLLKIYEQRNIEGIILETTSSNELVGYWWGNTARFQHRIYPKYIENLNGDFRGVAYFTNEAQDAAFVPSYRTVLINPAERAVIIFDFALENLPEIQEVIKKRGEVKYEGDEAKSLGYKSLDEVCYGYLRDPKNYKNTELGNLLETINQIIQSIKLIRSN